jgi:hypothetical protein
VRWDWYSATIPEAPEAVLGALCAGLDLAGVYPVRGLYSYDRGAQVKRGERLFATAFWGGVNGEESTHVQASGQDTPWVVSQLRQHWPLHRVSRADVCEDYSAPMAWRWLCKLALRVARQHRVKTNTQGDWIEARDGRTLYVGGRTSIARVRVYEKGIQMGLNASRDWVRGELQVRPTGDGKVALCAIEPAALFGATPWTLDFAERLGVPEIQAIRVRDPWRATDDDRALSFMLKQYGPLLERQAVERGGWDALGLFMGSERAAALKKSQCH